MCLLIEANAESTIHNFIKHYVSHFGVPNQILTDNGQNFANELPQYITQLFNITHLKTSPFHLELNGSIEQMHITLKEFLRTNNNSMDWTELPFLRIHTT